MLRSFLFTFLMLLFPFLNAQTVDAIFDLSDARITVNPLMIDQFDKTVDVYKFAYTSQSIHTLHLDSTEIKVETGVLNDWEDVQEEGFNVIDIYRNGTKVLDIRNLDIWTYTYDGGSSLDYKNYTDNRYFIPIKLSGNAMALCFVGWPYGSELQYLTVLVVTDKDAQLVFHKRMHIRNIEDKKLIVQMSLEEYDSSGILCTAPAYGEIYSNGGILYLKQ